MTVFNGSLCDSLPGYCVLQPDNPQPPRLEDVRGHEELGRAEVRPRNVGAPPAQWNA